MRSPWGETTQQRAAALHDLRYSYHEVHWYPAGSHGVIVHRHDDGEGYEAELSARTRGVVTVTYRDIAAADESLQSQRARFSKGGGDRFSLKVPAIEVGMSPTSCTGQAVFTPIIWRRSWRSCASIGFGFPPTQSPASPAVSRRGRF
jgi:hypothetical protein